MGTMMTILQWMTCYWDDLLLWMTVNKLLLWMNGYFENLLLWVTDEEGWGGIQVYNGIRGGFVDVWKPILFGEQNFEMRVKIKGKYIGVKHSEIFFIATLRSRTKCEGYGCIWNRAMNNQKSRSGEIN